MIPKKLENITFDDLIFLLENKVRENKTLEYKRDLPGNKDSEKIKYLTEICALANTEGGDLIFGITDEKGTPKDLAGLDIDNPDSEILRLENLIRMGLEPRISHSEIITIPSHENNTVYILIRIGKSWNAPHMVSHQNQGKFYKRNSAGKYPMDVSELRSAFVLSEQVTDKIRKFKSDRINRLKENNELPVNFYPGAKMVVHLMPLSAFMEAEYMQLEQVKKMTTLLSLMDSTGFNSKYNLDGIVNYTSQFENHSTSYAQLFRNGIIEAAMSLDWYYSGDTGHDKSIGSQHFEQQILTVLPNYLELYEKLDIEPPIYLFISFIGIKEFGLAVNSLHSRRLQMAERDEILIPEGIINSLDIVPEKILRPSFDMVWNAFGYARSFNYDENGNWVGRY